MYEHFKSFIHNMILTSQSDCTNKCSHLRYMRASILCTLIHNMYTFFITVLDGEEWNIIIAYMFNYLIITKVKYIIEFVKQCSHTELCVSLLPCQGSSTAGTFLLRLPLCFSVVFQVTCDLILYQFLFYFV